MNRNRILQTLIGVGTLVVFALPGLGLAADEAARAKVIQLDPAKARITWLGKKVTGQHNGAIRLKSGEVTVEGEEIRGGRLEIDMTTIVNEDIKEADTNAKLTGHLKSEDFFDVKKYPIAVLAIKQVTPVSGKPDQREVTSNLTIKEITRPISFPITTALNKVKAQVTGKVIVDRTKWNVRYGSGKFFKGLGDKLIYDEFEIGFDISTDL